MQRFHDSTIRLAECDWAEASRLLRPSLRPIEPDLGLEPDGSPALIETPGSDGVASLGPAGLPVVYVLAGPEGEAPVGAEQLEAWGVAAAEVKAAAMANLAVWDRAAGWISEGEGRRRMLWSECGDGLDAARILLTGVRDDLAERLGYGRVLVAMPERDLLIATGISEDDPEFEEMFADYVAERSVAADVPIDPRVFELVEGELVEAEVAVAA